MATTNSEPVSLPDDIAFPRLLEVLARCRLLLGVRFLIHRQLPRRTVPHADGLPPRVDAAVLDPPRAPLHHDDAAQALEFMRVLWEVDHELRRVSKSMESTLGVTGPQRLVIRMIGRFPGLAAGDLASLLHVDPSSLTGVLDRLCRAGFVARSSDPADGRRAHLSLTPGGRALDRVRSGTVEAAVVRAIAAQPRSRIAGARLVLEAVAKELTAGRPARATAR